MNPPNKSLSCRAWVGALLVMTFLAARAPVLAQAFTIRSPGIVFFDGTAAAGEFSLTGTLGFFAPAKVAAGGFTLESTLTLIATETAPLPVLGISLTANEVVISWPVAAGDFALDETSSLAGTIVWTPVSPPYVTNATQISLTVTVSSGPRFYRLRKP